MACTVERQGGCRLKQSSAWREWGIQIVVVILGLALVTSVIAWFRRPVQAPVKPASNATAVDASSPVDPGTSLHGRPAPDFTLMDQFGQQVSLSQFRGKVVVLAFVDSECTTICPLTTQSMVDALKLLGPDAAKQVQLLGINANPAAIKVSDVKNYSAAHDMLHSWHFLTGSLPQLKSMWKDYYIYAQIVQGQIDHTPALYIIDPQGKEQVLYLTPMQYGAISAQGDVLARDIARFLPASTHVNVPSIPYSVPQVTPDSSVKLPAISDQGTQGTVTVGPGHPQLLVFFASWVNGIRQDMVQLNTYSQGQGHPQVVAIDVAPTEPNSSAAPSLVRSLPHLNYPVGIDNSGHIADVYQAQDLTWMTLTDGKGHIIWSHDGWLSEPELTKDVTGALVRANVPAS